MEVEQVKFRVFVCTFLPSIIGFVAGIVMIATTYGDNLVYNCPQGYDEVHYCTQVVNGKPSYYECQVENGSQCTNKIQDISTAMIGVILMIVFGATGLVACVYVHNGRSDTMC
jgi:hypothetical protein